MTTNIDPSSICRGSIVVAPGAHVGPLCFLDGYIDIRSGAVLKGGITLTGDVSIGENVEIEAGVFLGSQKSGGLGDNARVSIGASAHVGAGSVLASGVTVGAHAWIEPGTVVMRNIPPFAIVSGNPAVIIGYQEQPDGPVRDATPVLDSDSAPCVQQSTVSGVSIHKFSRIRDLRGDLTVGEFERNVPFLPKRYFLVYDVPSSETRGEHAHRTCKQFLICVNGSVSIVVDDGARRQEIVLDQPNIGLYVPAGIWATQYKYSRNAALLVFASEYYDPNDYIRNYEEFLRFQGIAS